MYMINVKQQIEGRPPEGLLDRRYAAGTLKELADWCHAFIRACKSSGWIRIAHEKLPGEDEANRKESFDSVGLGQFMVLRREGNEKVITIAIFPTEASTPTQAARLFAL